MGHVGTLRDRLDSRDKQVSFHAQRMGIGWFVSGLVTGKQGDICESDRSHMGSLVLCSKLFFSRTPKGGRISESLLFSRSAGLRQNSLSLT